MTLPRWIAVACALALAAGTLAACGDDDEDAASNGGGADTAAQTAPREDAGGAAAGGGATRLTSIAVERDGLSFDRSELSASAGSVTVTLENPSGNQLPHAIEIEGDGVEEETATIEPGRSASVTVDLRVGSYVFYCPVGDHRAAGMEGTLTVR